MRITKYPQSCLLLEKESGRILIDPGSFAAEKYTVDDFLPLDGVLVTHGHADHAETGLLSDFANAGVKIVTNIETETMLGEIDAGIIEDGEEVQLGSFTVRAHVLPHCLMVDGSEGPQNTGYSIDGIFFHPGDGVSADGVEVQAAAVPIAGPDVSPHDAYELIQSLGAQTVIPVHYDYFTADPEFFKQTVARFDGEVNVTVLRDGEVAEL